MGCCGSNKNRSIRKQAIDNPAKRIKKATVQRVKRNKVTGQKRTVAVQRQRVVPSQKCSACGFPTMAVNIASRERLQCSNPNCRIIVK
jgi:hypothetical protein